MKILAVVVTYYPDKELLTSNIEAFVQDVDHILIWENTPESVKKQYRYINHIKVEYCSDNKNSISRALNYAWQYAKTHQYDYLLTMDQDSKWVNFSSFVKYVNNEKNNHAIYSPYIYGTPLENSINYIDWAITSGMLIPISIIDELGGYNERFAIDGIDMDFCIRAKLNNIPVIALKDYRMIQRFGTPQKKTFLLFSFFCYNYAASRYYEIYCSHLYFLINYRLSPHMCIRLLETCILKIPFKLIMYEDNKVEKIKSILRGVRDGYRMKA